MSKTDSYFDENAETKRRIKIIINNLDYIALEEVLMWI